MEADWRTAGLDERRVACLTYVEKLTLRPAEVVRSDLDPLRAAGLEDADVLALCEVTAYYAYVNRIADGLGVELESHLHPDALNAAGDSDASGATGPSGASDASGAAGASGASGAADAVDASGSTGAADASGAADEASSPG